MANELEITPVPAFIGGTVRALIFNGTAQVWSVQASAFTPFLNANIAQYAVTMTEAPAGSGTYVGNFPIAITTAGTYSIAAYKVAGSSLAITDVQIGSGYVFWDGTQEANVPANNDLISLTYAKQYLGITASTYDALISALISGASDVIRDYCNCHFTVQSVTELYDGLRNRELTLNGIPVLSIQSVTHFPDSSTPTVIDGSQFVLERSTGTIRLRRDSNSPAIFPSGFGSVQVVYTSGYDAIPTPIILATQMLVANMLNGSFRDMTMNSETIGDYQYVIREAYKAITPEIATILSKYYVPTI